MALKYDKRAPYSWLLKWSLTDKVTYLPTVVSIGKEREGKGGSLCNSKCLALALFTSPATYSPTTQQPGPHGGKVHGILDDLPVARH